MENDTPPDAKEQRRRAVSMLKRAASLPRMEGGRRPRMHTEAVSEGEKAADSRDDTPDIDTPPPEPAEEPVEFYEPPPQNEPEEEEQQTINRPPSRSRRRSRSRRSKDLKNRSQAPTPTHGDSSPELGAMALNVSDAPAMPPSPGPLNSLPPKQRMLRSPTPNSTDPLRSFSPSASPVLGMPSLEDIQRRGLLQRSHSTAGRQNAMAKLTGGQDVYDPSMSPSPTAGLRRNRTISGGESLATERTIARKQMLDRLVPRLANKDTDVEPNSGEEVSTPTPPETRKKRRRSKSNKRRGSGSASNPAVSDSDYIPTSPNTPIPPTSPLPHTPLPPEQPQTYNFSDGWPRSPTPNYLPRSGSPRASSRLHSPEPLSASPLHFSDQDAESVFSLPEMRFEIERPETKNRRRSIVVEEEEDDNSTSPFLPIHSLTPPQRSPINGSPVRVPHSSDSPSRDSKNSGFLGVPLYLSDTVSSRQEGFPTSPMQTPTKTHLRREDDEEEVLYTGESVGDYDREISWVALPVQELDGELNEEERPPSSRSSLREDDESSPRASVIIDSEPSPETTPSHIPPSPSSVAPLSHSASFMHASNDSISQNFAQRLSIPDRSPIITDFTDTEERPESSSAKRNGAWKKIKEFARSGSSTGRRSRTNSIGGRERRDYTDSSVSRESGASLHSGRMEKSDGSIFSMQQASHFGLQSPAASASVPILSPTGQFSPVPMSSSSSTATTDYQRYQNPKLYPFPVLHQQMEQRRIAEGASSSTPDVNAAIRANDDRSLSPLSPRSLSRDGTHSPQVGHQVSDTGMRIKYQNDPPPSIDYFNIPPGNLEGNDTELPTTLPAVRKWMKVKNMFTSAPTTPETAASKKPSLSDLLRIRKDTDVVTDKEDSTAGTVVPSYSPPLATPPHSSPISPSSSLRVATDVEQTPKTRRVLPPSDSHDPLPRFNSATPSPPDPMSPTPDMSSASEYPAQTVSSSSSSTTSSNYSTDMGHPTAAVILEKLEENLARSSRSPMWANAIDRPGRELLLSSSVLQVVNANTVKDRFLFLFSDMLVIAKPVNGYGSKIANDKSFIVKSVVKLHQLRFTGERTDTQSKVFNYSMAPRNPALRTFIHQFKKSPDHAISTLFSTLNIADDSTLLGQLLFRTIELDRAQLGDYLSRRTSKLVLRSYLDNFAFLGLRLDRALRAFLFSVHVTDRPSLDFLLDAFAIRWYDANAAVVAYNKSLAMNLVRAIVHLNEHVHGGLAIGPGISNPLPGVHSRDFIGAVRQSIDTRDSRDSYNLVSDDLLRDIFDATLRERLCMAVPTEDMPNLLNITVKRRIPEQLTYKVQSDPIHFKLPHADPHLSIHLYGQGLVFDPPVLSFAKSAEASFRVTGVSLGPKTFLMYRSGPNALQYTGLPLSSKVTVERAFMRNTFQVAFMNNEGQKRRYMFSLDDPIVKLNWTTELRRRCDDTASTRNSMTSKFHRAIDVMAFRALQDKLMSPAVEGRGAQPRKVKGGGGLYAHARSKSRSQVYHSQAGRNELDLGNGTSEDQDDTADDSGEDRRAWSLDELVVQCRQNSSIGLFLSYLQIGSPAS